MAFRRCAIPSYDHSKRRSRPISANYCVDCLAQNAWIDVRNRGLVKWDFVVFFDAGCSMPNLSSLRRNQAFEPQLLGSRSRPAELASTRPSRRAPI